MNNLKEDNRNLREEINNLKKEIKYKRGYVSKR